MSVQRYPFAKSPYGPFHFQLWDVKTIGVYGSYSTNYHVPPADQRARRVPADYRRAAVKCDSVWNGTPAGVTGAFEGYLASLPPVLGLGFGAFGEWSSEVDTLIGQMAEIAWKCAGAMRTGRGKISTERASGSSRGADMPRWIASSSSRRRRTWGTRNSVAGWMTPLMTLAFLMLGTPLTHEGRLGEGPAVAPRRYRWAVVRLTVDCSAFCYRL